MRAKHIFKAALVALTTGIVPVASAADLGFGPLRGTQYGAPMAQTHVWDGGYIGGFAGMSNGSAGFKNTFRDEIAFALRDNPIGNTYGVSSLAVLPTANGRQNNFGVFAGWNYQFDEIVLGIEADYSRLNLRNSTEDSLTQRNVSLAPLGLAGNGDVKVTGRGSIYLRNVTTLRARAGYTVGSFMPFVTAGVALADYRVSRSADLAAVDSNGTTILRPLVSSRKTRFGAGLAAGAGVDVAVAENFFLRSEWQYLHFPNLDGVVVDVNSIRAAAGVKF